MDLSIKIRCDSEYAITMIMYVSNQSKLYKAQQIIQMEKLCDYMTDPAVLSALSDLDKQLLGLVKNVCILVQLDLELNGCEINKQSVAQSMRRIAFMRSISNDFDQ